MHSFAQIAASVRYVLCFALLCFALLCFALLCCAVLRTPYSVLVTVQKIIRKTIILLRTYQSTESWAGQGTGDAKDRWHVQLSEIQNTNWRSGEDNPDRLVPMEERLVRRCFYHHILHPRMLPLKPPEIMPLCASSGINLALHRVMQSMGLRVLHSQFLNSSPGRLWRETLFRPAATC